MLTTSYEMLKKAYKGRYAVPAINTQEVPMILSGPSAWRQRSFSLL